MPYVSSSCRDRMSSFTPAPVGHDADGLALGHHPFRSASGLNVTAALPVSTWPPAAWTLAASPSRWATHSLIRVTKRSGSKSTLVRVENMASQVNLSTALSRTLTLDPAWATTESPLPYKSRRSWRAAVLGLSCRIRRFWCNLRLWPSVRIENKTWCASLGVVFYIIVLVLVDLFFTAEQSF
jgi:hypothetical protein